MKRYTVYYYGYDGHYYAYDNQTNCLVSGTASLMQVDAEDWVNFYNNY